MIRHIVLMRFRPEITAAEKAEIYGEIAALKPRLPGLLHVEAGPNVSPENLARGFNDGFVVTFADAAARDIYLADEIHRRTGAKIVAACVGGLDGVFVYDMEVADA